MDCKKAICLFALRLQKTGFHYSPYTALSHSLDRDNRKRAGQPVPQKLHNLQGMLSRGKQCNSGPCCDAASYQKNLEPPATATQQFLQKKKQKNSNSARARRGQLKDSEFIVWPLCTFVTCQDRAYKSSIRTSNKHNWLVLEREWLVWVCVFCTSGRLFYCWKCQVSAKPQEEIMTSCRLTGRRSENLADLQALMQSRWNGPSDIWRLTEGKLSTCATPVSVLKTKL